MGQYKMSHPIRNLRTCFGWPRVEVRFLGLLFSLSLSYFTFFSLSLLSLLFLSFLSPSFFSPSFSIFLLSFFLPLSSLFFLSFSLTRFLSFFLCNLSSHHSSSASLFIFLFVSLFVLLFFSLFISSVFVCAGHSFPGVVTEFELRLQRHNLPPPLPHNFIFPAENFSSAVLPRLLAGLKSLPPFVESTMACLGPRRGEGEKEKGERREGEGNVFT